MVVEYENVQLARMQLWVGTNVNGMVFDFSMTGEEGVGAKLGDSWDTEGVN